MTEAELREFAARSTAERAGADATDLRHWTGQVFPGKWVAASNMRDSVLVDGHDRLHHIAIVGSGPSAFFATAALLKAAESSGDFDVAIDMLEMQPTPGGLVRSGVAPDHPKIKSVSNQFDETAADPRLRFFGNIRVGTHVEPLEERYHAVIYAVGTQSDRALNIPGEDLPGTIAAVDFVGWYNVHLDFAHMVPDLSGGRAVVVGNGIVTLDVARIPITDPNVLAFTDIADHALESLRSYGVQEVVIIGRRGPPRAAFTTLVLRELGTLEHVDVVVAAVTDSEAAAVGEIATQNVKVLRNYAARRPSPGHRRIVLRFMTSPIEIQGEGKVERIILGRNESISDKSGRMVAADTGIREKLPAQPVVRAVGYRGVPIPGLAFEAETIPNTHGRVVGSRNEYVVGWIKRGLTGVIGANKKDAQDTVAALLAAALADTAPTDSGDDHSARLALHQSALVTRIQRQLTDEYERSAGKPHGRPRVKLVTFDESHTADPANQESKETHYDLCDHRTLR